MINSDPIRVGAKGDFKIQEPELIRLRFSTVQSTLKGLRAKLN
jgi:hypothetical protein